METQLFVIGDGHATFWNGTGDWHGANTIPGIRATAIPGALAWDFGDEVSTSNARHAVLGLVAASVQESFQGWIMLGFGTIDCDTLVWRQAQQLGFEEAVRRIVDRYVAFIETVKSMHPKVAIWGPVPTRHALEDESLVGSEAERRLAALVFTALLEERLAASDIPVLSIAECLLESPGISQQAMPAALALVHQRLGLRFKLGGPSPVALTERRADAFTDASYVQLFEKTWLQLTVPEGAQFFTDVSIGADVFSEIRSLGVATTWDGRNFEYEEVAYEQTIADASGRCRVHIARYARKILIYTPTRTLDLSELQFFIRGSQVQHSDADRGSLLALRDRIVHLTSHASSASAIPEFTAPPSLAQDVVFSEPPRRAAETVIFSEPPGMTPVVGTVWLEPDFLPTVSEAFTNAAPNACVG